MARGNQLDADKKLQGGSNLLSWLTLVTCLLTSLGLASQLQPVRPPLLFNPGNDAYQQAFATVILNIGDFNIASHISHAFRNRPLHEVVDYLTTTYSPSLHELLSQLYSLSYQEDEPITHYISRGQSFLTRCLHFERPFWSMSVHSYPLC
jgi:hypothetical protein